MMTKEQAMELGSMTAILDAVKAGLVDVNVAGQAIGEMQKSGGGQFSMKVSEKGCVSFRGMKGISVKFGLSLYPATLQALFARKEEIEKFMEANRASLSWEKSPKDDKPADNGNTGQSAAAALVSTSAPLAGRTRK